jgi:quercetin dioxygenase-like cupin family protein
LGKEDTGSVDEETSARVGHGDDERTTTMRRAIILVVLGVSTLALVVGAALATPPKDATTTVLTRATFWTFAHQNSGVKVESKREADVAIAKQVIEPGGLSGWHHHPAVSFFLVKSGSVTAYDEKCKKTVYKAGEGFIESSAHPGLVRNQGKVDAVIYATHIIPTKTTEEGYRIDDPKPKNCNVK